MRCIITRLAFNRWYLVNFENPEQAWSGFRWVEHTRGLATGPDVYINNFPTAILAREYAAKHCLEIMGIRR